MYTEQIPPILRPLPDEILGPRVLLRPRRPGDGEMVWEAIEESREELRPWLPWVDQQKGPEDCEATARRAAARWILREDLTITIIERATGRLLGSSGLHTIDWDTPSFEIGYWLRTSEQGKGYVTETVRLLCTLAFEQLGAQRVFIECDSRNERSIAVPRRLGFVHEGTLRNERRDNDGVLQDTAIFAMTPADFAAVRDSWKTPNGQQIL